MLGLLNNLSVRTRLWFLLGAGALGFCVIVAIALQQQRTLLLQDRQAKTRHLTEAAFSLLEHFDKLAKDGKLTQSDAQRFAKDAIRAARYDQKEYFWIHDLQQRVVVHPMKPELEGQDKSDMADPNGKKVYVEMNRVVRQSGAGFVDYYWPKPGSNAPVAKISYVKLFEPWGWVIGTGVYLDDLDALFWQSAQRLAVWTAGMSLVVGVIMLALARSITRPIDFLHTLGNVMSRVQRDGDLTQQVHVEGNDEISVVTSSFNQLIESFRVSMREVLDHLERVSQASGQLLARTEEVRRGAAQQSEQAAGTSAAVEELNVSVAQISEKTAEAADTATSAGERSGRGEQQVQEVVDHMGRIAQTVVGSAQTIEALGVRSRDITKIVKVIKDIADQTNLLALNAAIEAARAGEQGRGFAVVADEVRKLAERSSNATTEISETIASIQRDTEDAVQSMKTGSELVDQGVARVGEAGQAMGEITQGTRRIVDVTRDIALSLKEQSAAANDIAVRVERIARTVESADALCDTTYRDAQTLESTAQELRRALGRFRC